MAIIIAIISILGITGLVWLLNRFLGVRICPICAGVSGTWLWMLLGMFSGLLPTSHFQLPTSILMGGSVAGIAYQIEKRLPQTSASWRTPLLWKTLFIPTGFVLVYSVLSERWLGAVASFLLCVVWIIFFQKQRPDSVHLGQAEQNRKIADLEKKMENCC